jgi:hypothetical protein
VKNFSIVLSNKHTNEKSEVALVHTVNNEGMWGDTEEEPPEE